MQIEWSLTEKESEIMRNIDNVYIRFFGKNNWERLKNIYIKKSRNTVCELQLAEKSNIISSVCYILFNHYKYNVDIGVEKEWKNFLKSCDHFFKRIMLKKKIVLVNVYYNDSNFSDKLMVSSFVDLLSKLNNNGVDTIKYNMNIYYNISTVKCSTPLKKYFKSESSLCLHDLLRRLILKNKIIKIERKYCEFIQNDNLYKEGNQTIFVSF